MDIDESNEEIIGEVEYQSSKIVLIEPNSVTNAKYDFSAIQENILVCIIAAWQKFMTNGGVPVEGGIHYDLFKKPYVRIKTSEVAKGNNKSYVWDQLREMRKKDFTFTYSKKFKDKIVNEKVNTALINTIRNVEGSDYIDVSVSEWAIPYLLYFGKGVGGTIFNKVTALCLRSVYSKRIYKLCKQWEDKGGFTITVKEFRAMMGLENIYDRITHIKERVLEPARIELNEQADVSFECGFVKTGREVTALSFRVFGKKTGTGNSEWYPQLFRYVMSIFRELKDNQVRMICDQISEAGNLRAAAERFDQLVQDKALQREDRYYIGKKILIEDHRIEVTMFSQVKGAKRGKSKQGSTLRTSTVKPAPTFNFGGVQSIGAIMNQVGIFQNKEG